MCCNLISWNRIQSPVRLHAAWRSPNEARQECKESGKSPSENNALQKRGCGFVCACESGPSSRSRPNASGFIRGSQSASLWSLDDLSTPLDLFSFAHFCFCVDFFSCGCQKKLSLFCNLPTNFTSLASISTFLSLPNSLLSQFFSSVSCFQFLPPFSLSLC